tara:strand:+ start:248 stop:448 length:201 start_codon:yes stop_codon:yes gene_type:complete
MVKPRDIELGDNVERVTADGNIGGTYQVVRAGEKWGHAGTSGCIMYRFNIMTGEIIGGGSMRKAKD